MENKIMNRWMRVGLWILAGAVLFGAVFVAGRKFLAGNESVNNDKGQILKGQVMKYDAASLIVAIDGDGEMYFSDLTSVSVWVIKDDGKGERPQKTDWSKITVGQRVSLSMDKSGQKLISVIILTKP